MVLRTKSGTEKGFPSIVHCIDLGGNVVFLPSLSERREHVRRYTKQVDEYVFQVCVEKGLQGRTHCFGEESKGQGCNGAVL